MNVLTTYAIERSKSITSKSPTAADQRHRLLTLPVVVLRDEGGLSNSAIAAELGVSSLTVARVLAKFDLGPHGAPDISDTDLQYLYEEHSVSEVMALTGLAESEVSRRLAA